MYIYYGHHKCASTWIWQIIAGVCKNIGLSHRLVLDRLTPLARGPLTDYTETFSRSEMGQYLVAAKADMVSCITADMEQANALAAYLGVHVIRDPRDIIVSAYFSHRNSHPVEGLPHLQVHRERLRACSLEEGLLLEIKFSNEEINSIGEWDYNQPNVLELCMEDLTGQPYKGFLEIFGFLGLLQADEPHRLFQELDVFLKHVRNRVAGRYTWLRRARHPMKATGQLILGTVYKQRFESKTGGRRHGEVDENSHYRTGIHGDWVNHFTPPVIDLFKAKYDNLLVNTGYEDDTAWGRAASGSTASRALPAARVLR